MRLRDRPWNPFYGYYGFKRWLTFMVVSALLSWYCMNTGQTQVPDEGDLGNNAWWCIGMVIVIIGVLGSGMFLLAMLIDTTDPSWRRNYATKKFKMIAAQRAAQDELAARRRREEHNAQIERGRLMKLAEFYDLPLIEVEHTDVIAARVAEEWKRAADPYILDPEWHLKQAR